MEMSERKKAILRAIIETYVSAGLPVGSRTVANAYGQISSATIRNEMMDLEHLGYLQQPHTSAGRVPSTQAYRYYVDTLLQSQNAEAEDIKAVREYLLTHIQSVGEVMKATASAISQLIPYTAIVVPPSGKEIIVEDMQLIDVGRGQALLVLVTDSGIFKDAILNIPQELTRTELQELSVMMSGHLRGHGLSHISQVLEAAQARRQSEQQFVAQVIETIIRTISQNQDNPVQMEGMLNLLQHPVYQNTERLHDLLARIRSGECRYRMAATLPEVAPSMVLGNEIGLEDDIAILCVSIPTRQGKQGALGIIGPTRMPYGMVLSKLKAISRALEELLGG